MYSSVWLKKKKSECIHSEGRHQITQITYWNKIIIRLNTRFNKIGKTLGRHRDNIGMTLGRHRDEFGTKSGQNQDEIGTKSGRNWKRKNKTKKMQNKKRCKNKKAAQTDFIFIMTYLLNIGSRGRHKALCWPKNDTTWWVLSLFFQKIRKFINFSQIFEKCRVATLQNFWEV